MDYGNEKPCAVPEFQSSVGMEWGVVQSVVVEVRQTDDPRVTVEGDPVPHRRDYRVSLPVFAGVV